MNVHFDVRPPKTAGLRSAQFRTTQQVGFNVRIRVISVDFGMSSTGLLYAMLAAVQSGVGDAVAPKGGLSDVSGYEAIHATIMEPPIYLTASIVMSKHAPLTGAGEAIRRLFTDFVASWLIEKGLPGAEPIVGASL